MPEVPSGPRPDQIEPNRVKTAAPPDNPEIDRSRREFFRMFAGFAAGAGLLAVGVRMFTKDALAAEKSPEGFGSLPPPRSRKAWRLSSALIFHSRFCSSTAVNSSISERS